MVLPDAALNFMRNIWLVVDQTTCIDFPVVLRKSLGLDAWQSGKSINHERPDAAGLSYIRSAGIAEKSCCSALTAGSILGIARIIHPPPLWRFL